MALSNTNDDNFLKDKKRYCNMKDIINYMSNGKNFKNMPNKS